MAWVLVTGEDVAFYQNALRMLRPAGHDLVATPDGATVLQLLGDTAHSMVVLLAKRMGQMDLDEFLSAAAIDEVLRSRHVYLLLDGTPDELPAEIERYRAELAIPLVPIPTDVSDIDGWADLLDAISLATRQITKVD
jgi:CheY-like chemotaxis protein